MKQKGTNKKGGRMVKERKKHEINANARKRNIMIKEVKGNGRKRKIKKKEQKGQTKENDKEKEK